ncbi:MAG: Excinuclease ABC subunit B [Candidatus Magasanikbacteria bacterium]|nr:Excinuclease ABC subunit B [Candidatus Magasanikbacteria bacterium]
MNFHLKSNYQPAGDQPEAIVKLNEGLQKGLRDQTLLGATGTGKTFTVANVLQFAQKPTLVIAHNKTLAAQLCNEFREFFPESAAEYFVSYYDYYQPEAYLPTSDTYIEKEAMINEEIDRLRHAATQALLTRKDVIVVASVSCIYGLGSPAAYEKTVLRLEKGQILTRADLLRALIDMQFTRTTADLLRGYFRLRGESLEVMPVHQEVIYRFDLSGQRINSIDAIDPVTRHVKEEVNEAWIFPAKHYVTLGPEREQGIAAIREELKERLKYFEKKGLLLEAERLDRRTRFDLEMIEQTGFCHGIENYSRHFDGRVPGGPPYTLIDYFEHATKGDWLLVIDESHVTMPQIGGMYEGDASRKKTLIEYGFRLPSAADNRPLKFNEFEARKPSTIYVSATPGPYERAKSVQIVEQIIRPTGLIDPEIILRPIKNQVEDLIDRVKGRVKVNERALVTTLTKKMAEDLSEYLSSLKIKVTYLHSDIDTIERLQILTDFRRGKFAVLVGVNLLREGLDLPEVSLVAILDADKEGFLRSETSLIQTIGRAARNVRGQVILYADQMTGSMKRAITETERRRTKQREYNRVHGITPKTIEKNVKDLVAEFGIASNAKQEKMREKQLRQIMKLEMVGEQGKTVEQIIAEKEKQMKAAARNLDFELAAILRDQIVVMKIKK